MHRGLWSLALIIVVMIAYGVYFLMEQREIASQSSIHDQQTTGTPSVQKQNNATPISKNTVELCAGQTLKVGETAFLACPGKNKNIFGPLSITFGAQIARVDGKDYEAAVIFGDGEETTVAHWAPTYFNEEIEHTYPRAGEYDASLVLVPRSSLDADVMSRKKKIQDLTTLVLIKKIHIRIDASGNAVIGQ